MQKSTHSKLTRDDTRFPRHAGPGGRADLRAENVVRLFPERDQRALQIYWSPAIATLQHPTLARFAHICEGLLHSAGHILAEDFDLGCFTSAHQWMVVLGEEPDHDGLVYEHCGTGIADHIGADMTGRSIAELDGRVGQFLRTLYRSVRARKESVLCIHEPPEQVFVCSWRHLIVPLFDRSDRVAKLVAISVPDNEFSPGLEIIPDPVMVVDAAGWVRFANRAARDLFGGIDADGGVATLRRYCGFDLEVDVSPEVMCASGIIENKLHRISIGSHLADDFLVTVSAATQADRAFYIVMIRLALT